jgi:ATP-binding cassette subfamily C protein
VERIGLGHSLLGSVYPIISMAVLFAVIVWVLEATKPTSGFSVGSFVSFNGAFGQFLAGVLGLVGALNTIVAVVPLYERLRPILEAPSETKADSATPGVMGGEVRLSHATFRYNPEGPPTLDNVSLKIASGEYVAFVGASGSGKSTILRLVLGFEQPESGAVYLDGLDLATLDLRAMRRQIGVVLQSGRLQAGSIFENIVGAAPLTMDDAWEAARLAGLASDIEAMPMGLHTVLSEGAQGISGGQRQRLLIARALVRKPRLLILDEATSALDNRTQAAVKETLDKLNVTRIVVAHRLSTITDVHRIFVFDQGRLIETGGYKELLERGGHFAALARRQLT